MNWIDANTYIINSAYGADEEGNRQPWRTTRNGSTMVVFKYYKRQISGAHFIWVLVESLCLRICLVECISRCT